VETVLHLGLSNAVAASVLAVLAALAGWICRRPALTHALWLLVLLKLVTPPLMRLPLNWSAPNRSASTTRDLPAVETPSTSRSDELTVREVVEVPALTEPDLPPIFSSSAPATAILPVVQDVQSTKRTPDPEPAVAGVVVDWQGVVLTLWLLGSGAWFSLAGWRVLRFQRLLRYAWPADNGLQRQARLLAGEMGLGEGPVVWLVPGRVSPLLWFLGARPRLVLPADLLPRLSENQRQALLAHELAHLRRRDHWVRLLELVVTGLYWWHPVVWWARREIGETEEQCCDAWVVWALPAAARGYALALVETVDFLSEARPALPLAASGIGYVHDLKRRMTMIMRGSTPRTLSWGGGLVVLAVALFVLPLLPTFAQDTIPPAEDPQLTADDEVQRAEQEVQKATQRLKEAKLARLKHSTIAADMTLKREECLRCHVEAVTVHAHLALLDPDGDKPDADLSDTHDAVVKLMAEVQQQRAQLQASEAKLEALMKRLDDLAKRKAPTRPGGADKRPAPVPEIVLPDPVARPPSPVSEPKTSTTPEGTQASQERRLQELTIQLERLQRELDLLRQEMVRPNPDNTPAAPPAVPRRNVPPPRLPTPAFPAKPGAPDTVPALPGLPTPPAPGTTPKPPPGGVVGTTAPVPATPAATAPPAVLPSANTPVPATPAVAPPPGAVPPATTPIPR
jgi:beta-lactamase regulating signal transducer with metallopeptidase domain